MRKTSTAATTAVAQQRNQSKTPAHEGPHVLLMQGCVPNRRKARTGMWAAWRRATVAIPFPRGVEAIRPFGFTPESIATPPTSSAPTPFLFDSLGRRRAGHHLRPGRKELPRAWHPLLAERVSPGLALRAAAAQSARVITATQPPFPGATSLATVPPSIAARGPQSPRRRSIQRRTYRWGSSPRSRPTDPPSVK